MKKVLIISYYFPPCNLTGANRIASWAEYLHLFGYYPVIVTRSWNIPISTPEDVLRSSGSEIITEKNDCYTVHYLPYKASLRDRLFTSEKKLGKTLSKFFSLINLITQNFSNHSIPYINLYYFSKELLSKDRSIDKLIISGDPFVQFKFGYRLHRQFGIRWIADYRDGWNTQELEIETGFMHRLIRLWDRRSEKKWVQTASFITSVSDTYTSDISRFVNVKGETILNGYLEKDLIYATGIPNKDRFTLAYSGALYNSQRIEIFLEGYKRFIDLLPGDARCELHFIGLKFDVKQSKRIEELMEGYDQYVTLGERVSRVESLEYLGQAHLLLLTGYEKRKGIPGSKLFDYLALDRPILICPTDSDIMEKILLETNKGIIANTAEDVTRILQSQYNLFLEGHDRPASDHPSEKVSRYSRKNSTATLAKLLDQL
ncbi:MAG TPA: hypothetical protein DCX54_04090 [Flavobacteriales bacterium]|nr:hypothetical protein [Flavobacteriales bacterium]